MLKPTHQTRLFAAAASVAVCAVGAASASGQNYDFVSIADSNFGFDSFQVPSINNASEVAFVATTSSGKMGVFVSDNSLAFPDPYATTSSSGYGGFTPLVTLAPDGTVGFFATVDRGGPEVDYIGLFTGPNPETDAVATSLGAFDTFTFATLPPLASINVAGTVAFLATLDSGGIGVFTGPDPVADAVATSDGPFGTTFFPPDINASGTVVFAASLDGGGSGLFTGPDPVTDAVLPSGSYSNLISNYSINDAGTIAFQAVTNDGFEGIFTGPDSVADAVVTSQGPFTFFEALSINNPGTVSFVGTLDDGRRGLYTGPDLIADRVIEDGDALFGSSLTTLSASEEMLNDFGDIAFRYGLDNGETGIAVALAAYRYTSDTGGSFDDQANFAFGARPGDVVPTLLTPDNGLVITGPATPRILRSLTIGTAGSGVAELQLQPGAQLTLNEMLTVQDAGKVRVDGTLSALGGVNIDAGGEIELVNDAQVNGGPLLNFGTLRGDGTVGNAVDNFGRIEVIGTPNAPKELAFTELLTNRPGDGAIFARNASLRFQGGLDNAGGLGISFGTTDIFGDVNNDATGRITVSGGSQATFFDDVVQNGTLQVSSVGGTSSAAVFFGSFTGSGGATGGGDLFFEGDLRPGNSPACVTFDNDVFLGSGAMTEIEIEGTALGEFDKFIINGDLSLDGSLVVTPLNAFMFADNQFFTIFDVSGTLSGAFDGLLEGDVVDVFNGQELFITYAAGSGNDVALFTVPEPASATTISFLAALALRRRRS